MLEMWLLRIELLIADYVGYYLYLKIEMEVSLVRHVRKMGDMV